MKTPAALAALALALSASGCAVHMKVEPGLLDRADAWPVGGAPPRAWSRPLSFGPWHTALADDATALGWSAEVLGLVRAPGARRPQALRLEGPAGTLEVECLEQQLQAIAPFGVAVDLEALQGTPTLSCAFRPHGASGWTGAWTLVLRDTGEIAPAFEGELRNVRGVSFGVRSVHALSDGAPPAPAPIGYAFDRAGVPAAAVERLGAGRVIIARRESDAMVLAAASAALLLFTPP